MSPIRFKRGVLSGLRRRANAARAAAAAAAAVAIWAPMTAQSQILRSPVPLPNLPTVSGPLSMDASVRDTLATLNPRRLADLRVVRLRTLVRAHADVLESDPEGAPIVRREVLAWSPSVAGLAQAAALGFATGRRTPLAGGDELVVLVAPAALGTGSALMKIRRADPTGVYDFNHVFVQSGEIASREAIESAPHARVTGDRLSAQTIVSRAGLIDGGVDAGHYTFAGATLHAWGCPNGPIATAHGTAVASLLVGRSADFRGAVPDAELFAADVFCGAPTGGSADAIVGALGWLLSEHVPVINVSLVGPPNGVLERVFRAVLARGSIVVAAVGNDGPAAPPSYPASYPGVVAVTAIDRSRHLLLEAGRALHVDLAAPGADLLAAGASDALIPVRGTSFASPLVAGLLARELRAPDVSAARAALEHLEAQAAPPTEQGAAARYGKGIVGESVAVRVPVTANGRNPAPRSF